jgi:hypothetical protein
MKRLSSIQAKSAKNDKTLHERLTPDVAKALVLKGESFDPALFSGSLNLEFTESLKTLPAGLQLNSLSLRGCCNLATLPDSLQVRFDLVIDGCESLTELPENLTAGSLSMRDCTGIEALPEGLEVYFLNISGCVNLKRWPVRGNLQFGNLVARNCVSLTELPSWLGTLSILDVRDSANLRALPENLVVNSWLDLAGTGITSLPEGCRNAQLRWRGIPVPYRIVFEPETITAGEVLDETNLELRRVKLERMGYDRFIQSAHAKVLDRDEDPGGERKLLRIEIPGDEDLVCVSVQCPSTGRLYVIRVPPDMTTCRQAVAWIAGFDDPDQYQPLIET